jgi:hypothetical protein
MQETLVFQPLNESEPNCVGLADAQGTERLYRGIQDSRELRKMI